MVPTIGRRMYFFVINPSRYGLTTLKVGHPMDAGVIFVNDDNTVNLQVTDHVGVVKNFHAVTVVEDPNETMVFDYWVEWMPYQKEQAAKQET